MSLNQRLGYYDPSVFPVNLGGRLGRSNTPGQVGAPTASGPGESARGILDRSGAW